MGAWSADFIDAAAAEDGLSARLPRRGGGDLARRDGPGFRIELKRDLGALLSWRIEAIEADTFSCVLLSVMEAIAQSRSLRG